MKILFFGPIAKQGKPATGGFEAANRKNIDELRHRDIDVVEFANPIIRKQFGSIAKLVYIKLLFIPFHLLCYAGKKNVLIHTTPLYNHLLWPSVFLVWMAKRMGIPVLMDIRAGSLINLSRTKSKMWMKGIKYMLDNSTEITVEGKSYLKDIVRTFDTKVRIQYFPNITYCQDVSYSARESSNVNLIYFGRITKHKGIDLLMRMMPLLDNRYRLFLAGNIDSDINMDELKVRNVFYLGALSPTQLKKTLQKMHIFMFPTKWSGEGQSNSLIESMQNGLVPISSDQGFCRDVIDDCGMILSQDCSETDYRDAVLAVTNENLEKQGKKAMEHIENYHNIDNWIPWLIDLYKEMIE